MHPLARWVVLAAFTVFASAALAQAPELPVRPDIPEQACPTVRLELVPSAQRGMGLRVVNNDPGDFDAHLGREVVVEREVNGRWQRVSVAGFSLRERCDATAPECVSVPARGALLVAPWTGMQGDGQCVCTRCAPAPAGRYRFAVTSCRCQHPRTTHSEAFTLD